MCIIGMSCRRRGTSTVFGVMIFIGIMFTAVIPMFLVMNQADTLQEIRKVEVGRLDEEHGMEDIYFYLTPTVVEDEPILTLKISNRGELAVRITRVWINDTLRDGFDCIISPIGTVDLDFSLIVPTESVVYHVMAVTDRGNIFSPICGIPNYDPVLKVWTMGDYVIDIRMEERTHSLHISVVNIDTEDVLCDEDFPPWRFSYPISVPDAGFYNVTVTRFYGQKPQYTLLTQNVLLTLLHSSVEVKVPA